MNRIARMISKMVLFRLLIIATGLSIFVLTLEVVAYSGEILKLNPNAALAMLNYAGHRLPQTLGTFLPISMLLAILLALTELSYRNELSAIWSMGISSSRLLFMLAPFALLVGVAHFLIQDVGVPWAAPTLREWAIGDYSLKALKNDGDEALWMRSGTDILRAAHASPDSKVLDGVIIFKRDANGLLQEQIFAKQAVQGKNTWQLTGVTIYFRGNRAPEQLAEMTYGGTIKAATAGSRSGDPEEMSFGDLSYFISNNGFGIRPAFVYQTWLHKRLTAFVISLVMLAICLPLTARFRRGGGLGFLFMAGVALGFAFFVFDGISLSMGELGFIAPWLAAWAPVLIFAAAGVYLNLRTEQI
ncbi:MAG: LptF/LptG family permease [Hyphomicrobiales bacterium]